MKDFIDVAISAAKEAGRIHKKYFNKKFKIRTKGKSFNLVTIVDLESEKRVVSLIRKHYPRHNFLAEEEKYKTTDSDYTWIIDPLDGTSNFSHSLPVFCVSIALAKKNDIILGVIYDVMRDELFYAEKQKGAYLNNKKINASKIRKLEESILVTGFYYDRGEMMLENLERIKWFLQARIRGIRRFGSAAMDLAYVASGRVTGFWEFELNAWDFAAGKIIVEEAGGKVTGRKGESLELKKCFVVASNGKIHRKMLDIINR